MYSATDLLFLLSVTLAPAGCHLLGPDELLIGCGGVLCLAATVVRRISGVAVVVIGRELNAVQERLAGKGRDGMFRPWLEKRCGFSHTIAYQDIAAYHTFGDEKCKDYLHLFDDSAIRLLSTESCPPEARKEAIRRWPRKLQRGRAIA